MSTTKTRTPTTTTTYTTITLPATATTTTTVPTPSPPSRLTFIARATAQTQTLTATLRPFPQFLSLSSLSLPTSYSDFTSRLRRNLTHFRSNYTLIILIILFLSLIFHPISLIVFLLLFFLWMLLLFSRERPIRVWGREIGDGIVILGLGVVTVVGLVGTGVGVNVLVGLVVGVGVVGLHAGFRGVEDVYLDEDEVADVGFGSIERGVPLRTGYGRLG